MPEAEQLREYGPPIPVDVLMQGQELIGEYRNVSDEGEEAYVKVWDDGFDFNGNVALAGTSPTNRDRHAVLKVLMEHQGRPLTKREIITDTDFLEQFRQATREVTFTKAFSDLQAMSEGTNLISTGNVHQMKWYGMGVRVSSPTNGEHTQLETEFDFSKLGKLVTEEFELEIFRYIFKRKEMAIDLTSLSKEATQVSIPGDRYARVLVPKWNERAEEKDLGFFFKVESVQIEQDLVRHLIIEEKKSDS